MAEKDFSAKANAELSLYNLTMKVNRLELLQYQLDLEMLALAEGEHQLTERFLNEEYVQTLQAQAGLLGESVLTAGEIETVAKATLNTPFKGAVWSDRLWQRQDALRAVVAQMTEDYLLKGKNPTTMLSRLRQEFGVSASVAKRLAVTEGARVATEAERQSYLSNGYEEYEFIAEPKACDICKPLDGKIFKVLDMVPGLNASPMHPNCRCATAAHYSGGVLEGESSKTLEKATEKVYNQGMNNLDLMGKHRRFNAVGKDSQIITAKTRKIEGTAFDIWSEKDSKNYRDTVDLLQSTLKHYHHEDMPTFVILSNKKLSWGKRQGLAAYDYTQNVMFLSSNLISEENVRDILSDGHFAARNFDELLEHELTHKTHWDNVKRLYKHNPKRYNNVEEAKRSIDSKLLDYVAQQRKTDRLYVKNVVSPNAHFALLDGNVNELVADVNVLSKTDRLTDTILLKLVKEVLGK